MMNEKPIGEVHEGPKSYLLVFLKGLAMGAADVVPGVSGGTIAFITGIYKRLLNAINSIDIDLFKSLMKSGISPAWTRVDGNFLLVLFSGILVSILSLSKLVLWGLKNYNEIVWSFFFGLILASIPLIFSNLIKNIHWSKWLLYCLIGIFMGSVVTFLPLAKPELTLWYVFLSGFIAICAMILPGISGSFILILLGSYEGILDGLNSANWSLIIVFIAGAILGLISFGRSLRYLFEKIPNIMTALMGGFIIGSLVKIYPFKIISSNGIEYPRLISFEDPILFCSLSFLLGLVFISGLNLVGKKKSNS